MELKRILSATNGEIAITALDEEITYRNFYIKISEYAKKLEQAGITNKDRVLVIGHPDYMIETISWTYGAMFMGASPANASFLQSKEEINLKSKSANVKAHIWYDGRIEIVSDISFKQHLLESYVYFSSNTTIKKDNLYSTEPAFFSYPNDWKTGSANEDVVLLMNEYLGKVPLKQLNCMSWEIAYAQHCLANCLMSGGSWHWVKNESDFAEAQEKYKTNSLSTYPISMERICSFGKFKTPIDFVEISGGACPPSLINKIRSAINPRFISNSFSTVGVGLLLTKVISRDEPGDDIEYMKVYDKTGLQVKLDETGLMYFSRNSSEWISDGDIFDKINKSYKFRCRSHDQYLNFKGGKISTWEIEGYANDLLKTIKGCGNHTYVFPMNGLDGYERHGLIYSGNLPAKDLRERLSSLISYKRPQVIYRVSDNFWITNNYKISRARMAEKIKKQSHQIIEKVGK